MSHRGPEGSPEDPFFLKCGSSLWLSLLRGERLAGGGGLAGDSFGWGSLEPFSLPPPCSCGEWLKWGEFPAPQAWEELHIRGGWAVPQISLIFFHQKNWVKKVPGKNPHTCAAPPPFPQPLLHPLRDLPVEEASLGLHPFSCRCPVGLADWGWEGASCMERGALSGLKGWPEWWETGDDSGRRAEAEAGQRAEGCCGRGPGQGWEF